MFIKPVYMKPEIPDYHQPPKTKVFDVCSTLIHPVDTYLYTAFRNVV